VCFAFDLQISSGFRLAEDEVVAGQYFNVKKFGALSVKIVKVLHSFLDSNYPGLSFLACLLAYFVLHQIDVSFHECFLAPSFVC
jgi:hypothetical protein